MLNKHLIQNKIDFIQKDLARLAMYKDITYDDYTTDYEKQASIERMFERVINRAIDINQHIIMEQITPQVAAPLDYRETFTKLAEVNVLPKNFADEISKSAGFRNMLVHNYDDMDDKMIYNSIKDALRDYPQYCEYILQYLEKYT